MTLRATTDLASRRGPVLAVGTAQIVGWAASIYLPAVIAQPLAGDLGIAPATVYGAFSCALLVTAAVSPAAGRAIDRHGGRGVLCLSNLLFAAGLLALGSCGSLPGLFLAWAIIGAGMALGLYDAAFAALVRLYGVQARGAITGITLLGGFASTLGWPLGTWLVAQWDWRVACFVWAVVHLVVCLPLHRFGLPAIAPESVSPASTIPVERNTDEEEKPAVQLDRTFILLAVYGASTAFVTSAMAAHLPGVLLATGIGTAAAVTAAALLGPAQVLARLGEFGITHRFKVHPLHTARVATALHPLAAGCLLALGGTPATAVLFAVLHGAGNGLITIAKGTLPLALFGPAGYGHRQGLLAVAQRLVQAASPYVFALVLAERGLSTALLLSAGVMLLSLGTLFLLRKNGE